MKVKMIGVVKTKNVFAPFEESDGERYLITRHYAARPKSMKALHIVKWIRDLAPSKELLSDYHKGLSPEKYTSRFNQEQSNPKAQEMRKMLWNKSRDGNVTLLCICKEGEFCHRLLVKEMIERED
jgi:uncharacterized protein YeaO (DUF488 family)